VGLTDGEHLNEENERLAVPPMTKGLSQLIGLILALDRGCCDDT
jgi:hypothetical protein